MRLLFKMGTSILILGLLIGVTLKSNPVIADNEPPDLRPVKVEGRQLLVDFDGDRIYQPYLIKGVGYSPFPIGAFPADESLGVCEYCPEQNCIYPDPGQLLISCLGPDYIYDRTNVDLDRDFTWLVNMNANTIRTWSKVTTNLLDKAEEHGIKVIAGFWIHSTAPDCVNGVPDYNPPEEFEDYDTILTDFEDYVRSLKDVNDADGDGDHEETHPAILFWAIGNENNLHLNPNDTEQITAWYSFVDAMAGTLHDTEGPNYRPVAVVNGDLQYIGVGELGTTDNFMTNLDIWGANVYRGESFVGLFDDYAELSGKPLWVSEYGVDAWTSNIRNDSSISLPGDYLDGGILPGYEDESSQAEWIGNLWDEIYENRNICIGGNVMEYSDEWWKPTGWIENDPTQELTVAEITTQDHNGTGPVDNNCDGNIDWTPQSPDNFFNEEWWGIMAIEDNGNEPDIMHPRQVYYTLQSRFRPIIVKPPVTEESPGIPPQQNER